MTRMVGTWVRVGIVVMVGIVGAVGLVAQTGNRGNVLDANTATEAQLTGLPHMTAALAKAVIGARPFMTALDLDRALASLSAAQKQELYSRLFVQINLNTATEAEIRLIPGMTNRMVHEFEEYRPYKAMAQWRKEIAKYVKPDELARLEQYVFVPINLNTASDQDMLSIPNLNQRMLREFKEYRPYKSIEHFRKEIGKYVDKKELARLERYVTIQ